MTANFVTFYLIIVLITGPFFQYLPVTTYLKWDEVLLAKILNQAPTVFLLGYLLFPSKRIIPPKIFIVFLLSSIIPEIYYYVIHPDNQFLVIVINNTISYGILIAAFIKCRIAYDKISTTVWAFAIGLSVLVFMGFSIASFEIYEYYFFSRPFTFVILISFILLTVAMIFFSCLTTKPFKRTWFELTMGSILIVLVDIYVYNCFFVLNSQPELLFTFGKVLTSLGFLLLADGFTRRNSKANTFICL